MAIEAVNNMEYYITEFLHQNKVYYFIWVTDDKDRFLTENNKILYWDHRSELLDFAKENGITFEEEEHIRYNLDKCEKWCRSSPENIDCGQILDMWNIFSDFYNSIEEKFMGNDHKFDEIYDKIFCGNNLPTINKTNKIYVPLFSEDEILAIKKIMLSGICLFRKVISGNR